LHQQPLKQQQTQRQSPVDKSNENKTNTPLHTPHQQPPPQKIQQQSAHVPPPQQPEPKYANKNTDQANPKQQKQQERRLVLESFVSTQAPELLSLTEKKL
jgi:hypothetical protein